MTETGILWKIWRMFCVGRFGWNMAVEENFTLYGDVGDILAAYWSAILPLDVYGHCVTSSCPNPEILAKRGRKPNIILLRTEDMH
ncbi:hypothetical protein PoB_001506600 [Plakobranchus ocellatus]|uniref:Uncharacterized protein n=1 Tax=Plakobranchus ocellatus TaxID=259542 RepID=A0AAV3YYD1_9GAST|nr:hypothetical protein PoB_001506600 [Plakobranchus ocellatus]